MSQVTFSELRANMARYFDRVEADRKEMVVVRQGHEAMVLVPQGEWEGIQETNYLLSSPRNAERLLAGIREIEAGGGRVFETAEALEAARRDAADPPPE